MLLFLYPHASREDFVATGLNYQNMDNEDNKLELWTILYYTNDIWIAIVIYKLVKNDNFFLVELL